MSFLRIVGAFVVALVISLMIDIALLLYFGIFVPELTFILLIGIFAWLIT